MAAMLKWSNWMLGGCGIFVFLLLLNYVFSGEIGFFHAGMGRSHGREALLIVAALCSLVWGTMLALIPGFPGYVAKMAGGYEYGGGYSTEWRPKPPPPIVKGFAIPGNAIDYGVPVVSQLKPALVLLSLTAFHQRHPDYERLVEEGYLDRTGSSPSSEDLAELERKKVATRAKHLSDPNFLKAAKRLTRAGVECEFGGQGDMCGEFSVLRIIGSVASFPLLEAMAADDVGITGQNERAQAADRFRIFMLRNYGPDWEANRAIYPDVGGSPYSDRAYWPKST
jgi:hypothetical protein